MSHETPSPIPEPEQQVLDAAREVIDSAGPYEVARDEQAMGEIQGALDEGIVNIIKDSNDVLAEARVAVDEATPKVVMEDVLGKMNGLTGVTPPLKGKNERLSALREEKRQARAAKRSETSFSKFGKSAGFRRYRPQ